MSISQSCNEIEQDNKDIKSFAQRGGKARAKKLSQSERSDIAKFAAEKRWGNDILITDKVGILKIDNQELECAVLKDGTRLLNQSTVLMALDRAPEKSRKLLKGISTAPFLSAANLQPYISDELRNLDKPIPYKIKSSGIVSLGYKAELLPKVCKVYLDARRDNRLIPVQYKTAAAAEIIVSALANVGIVALIDEVTGYQDIRAKDELQELIQKYVQVEYREWVKTFPDEFFELMYKINGWKYQPGNAKRTPYVGKLINHYIYEQLPPGVLEDLQNKNPILEKGYRKYRHHQFLTVDTGNIHLDRQISNIMMLMRMSRNKEEFEQNFDKAFPKPKTMKILEISVPQKDTISIYPSLKED